MTSSIVICSIFFTRYQLFRMEELLVCPIPNFIYGDKMNIIYKLVLYIYTKFFKLLRVSRIRYLKTYR